MIRILFWAAAALVAYIYLVFPLLVMVRGRLQRRPYHTGKITPRVSMIVAAYNEARSIRAKLDNIIALKYPNHKLEVVIASDGSTDGTEEIVKEYADRGVRLLALPRVGKAAALNAAVAASSGEILVFSDANSMYAPDAIHALVRPFADPAVGGVAGNQCYIRQTTTAENSAGERSYWNLDRRMKQSQSRAGNAISATGAIYAIRRSLFQTVPAGVTDDFVTSTRVIAQGYRLVFAPDAIAYEPPAESSGKEFGRKVRVITRGLRAVMLMHELLNPLRYGFYALQLFSHKVLRRLAFLPLIMLFLASPWLWNEGWFYQGVLILQLGFYGCAAVGAAFGHTRIGRLKPFAMPFFFCMVNAAAMVASLNILRRRRIDFWETQRSVVGSQ